MPLIACPDCGHQVSTSAVNCPSCGNRVKPKSKLWRWLLGVPMAAFVLLVMYDRSLPEYERHARQVRKACEEGFMARGMATRQQCDDVYYETRRKGQEKAEGTGGCPAAAPDCSWGNK